MKTLQKYFLLLLFLIPIGLFAQTTVTGTVTEKATGVPLPAVNVVVKGTTNGVATDFDGNYSIQANIGDVLVFSYIGFRNYEVTVASTNINVGLEEDASQLDEVVVVGYGSSVKKDITGSVESVSTKDFNAGAIVSPEQLIAGKTAGVQVTPPSGAPGSGSTIKVRGGVSSLSASSNPLIVVDGVPLDQGNSGLNYINANDIETFTVLKDASAASIYGSRATGGVILITTKSGKSNDPLNINFSHYSSIGNNIKETDILSAKEFRAQVLANGNDDQIASLGSANTDFQNEIYRAALTTDTNLTFSGGFKNSNYRLSLGYVNQDGTLLGSNVERYTGSFKFIQRLLDDDLRIEVNVLGAALDDTFANTGAIGSAVSFDPTQPVLDAGSPFGGFYEHTNNDGSINSLAPRNPVGLLTLYSNIAKTKRSTGNLKLDYTLPFMEDITVTANLGYDYFEVEGNLDIPAEAGSNFNSQGLSGIYSTLNRSRLADFYVNYKKDIEAINSVIDFTAGQSFQYFYRSNSFANEDGLGILSGDLNKAENALLSYFGRLNYTLADKYLLTLNLRNDRSSRLNPDDRSDIFGGVSVGWNIIDENFLKDSKVFSQLKIRGGYGETGNQEFGQDYQYIPRYTTGDGRVQYQFGYNTDGSPRFVTTIRPEEYDENLKWERSKTINLGLEFGFLDDRISGSVEVYERKVEDLINFISVPAGTNLSNALFTNIGNLENRGIELSLNLVPFENENFKWDTSFNISFFENEVTKLTLIDDDASIGSPTGGISGGVGNTVQINTVGYPVNSFFVLKQIYNEDGKPIEGAYVDRNGDNVIDDNDKYRYNSPNPDAVIGFTSYMEYGNLDFSFTLRGSIGNFAYNNVASSTGNEAALFGAFSVNNVSASLLDTDFKNPQFWSDYYVQDASFLKLDNATIGYNVNDLFDRDVNLRLYVTGQNLLTVTDYDGLDPEISGGIDNNFYPRSRTVLIGLNLNL